jgi:glucosamine-6-phosphate deaminase
VKTSWMRDGQADMSVRQILKANEIICVVPDARRAMAVRICIEGEIRPMAPASILRPYPTTTVYLDKESASLLSSATWSAFAAGG